MSQLSPTAWREVATEDLIGPLNDVEQQYAPPTLFVAGDLALLHHGARVAIVGARQATSEGCARARKLASRVCDRGMVVVSGLAQGRHGRASGSPGRRWPYPGGVGYAD